MNCSSGYGRGVLDALERLSFEEAVTCGFPDPYSTVVNPGPLGKLLELRRKRLLDQKMDIDE